VIGVLEPVEGGILGELIGWGLSIVPSLAGAAISFSSRDPKGFLKNVAALVPVVGQDFVETMDRVDSIATNAYNKTSSVIEGVRSAVDAVNQKSAFGDALAPLAPLAPTNLQAVPPQ
jgi:phage tail protein X